MGMRHSQGSRGRHVRLYRRRRHRRCWGKWAVAPCGAAVPAAAPALAAATTPLHAAARRLAALVQQQQRVRQLRQFLVVLAHRIIGIVVRTGAAAQAVVAVVALRAELHVLSVTAPPAAA